MSRSSWLACPSCCEVAMFYSDCSFTLTSTELYRKLQARITPPPRPLLGNFDAVGIPPQPTPEILFWPAHSYVVSAHNKAALI